MAKIYLLPDFVIALNADTFNPDNLPWRTIHLTDFGWGVLYSPVKLEPFLQDPITLTDSRLSYNLLINGSGLTLSVDWLASKNIFYSNNIITSFLGSAFNGPIDINQLSSLQNHSYNLFGNPYINSYKRLQAYEKLHLDCSGGKPNLTLSYPNHSISINSNSSSRLIFDELKVLISQQRQKQKCIIPLTSGYDSRLILLASLSIYGNENIITSTLQIGGNYCFESTYAKELSDFLNVTWIPVAYGDMCAANSLHDKYFKNSLSYNGAYFFDFTAQLAQIIPNISDYDVISGIIGDLFSGKLKEVESNKILLNHSNGLSPFANQDICNTSYLLKYKEFFECQFKNYLPESARYLYLAGVGKLPHLEFLVKAFEHYGCNVLTPFTDFNLTSLILSLPSDSRQNRQWQIDIFQSFNLNSIPKAFPTRRDYSNKYLLKYCQEPPKKYSLKKNKVKLPFWYYYFYIISQYPGIIYFEFLLLTNKYLRGVLILFGYRPFIFNAYQYKRTLSLLNS